MYSMFPVSHCLILIAGRFHAFEAAHNLDRNSSGRGVRQFKTSLLQRLELVKAQTVANHDNVFPCNFLFAVAIIVRQNVTEIYFYTILLKRFYE